MSLIHIVAVLRANSEKARKVSKPAPRVVRPIKSLMTGR